MIVGNNRRYSCKQTNSGGDQSFGYSGGNCHQAGRSDHPDFVKSIHNSPDCAEQANKGSNTPAGGQKTHHLLQPVDLFIGCPEKRAVDQFQFFAINWILRLRIGSGQVNQFLKAGLKDSRQWTILVSPGSFVYLIEGFAAPEGLQELTGSNFCPFQAASFVDDDRPGKNGKKN